MRGRAHSDEFRNGAVARVVAGEKPRVVADDLDISYHTLAKWLPPRPRIRRRRSRPRSKTIARKRLTREELRAGRLLYPPVDIKRPMTRAQCAEIQRPCPWVACRHHMYLDVLESGNIKINFPDLEPDELTNSCALDVYDRGGITLEEVGDMMNLTRERVRQIEVKGLIKIRAASPSVEEVGAELLNPKETG